MSDAVLIALIVGFFGSLTALISAIGVIVAQRTHKLINSRMDELLAAARAEGASQAVIARAEGVAAGEQSQRDRAAPSDQPGGTA